MNTPNDASDSQIARLLDDAADSALAHAADLAADPTLAERLDNDPAAREAQRVIDLRRQYRFDWAKHPWAPPHERWSCVNALTYDGATHIGRGADRKSAMLDLLDQHGEFE